MSLSHKGDNNVFYNKSLPKATLDAAALVNSDPVWVYYEDSAPAAPGRDPGPLKINIFYLKINKFLNCAARDSKELFNKTPILSKRQTAKAIGISYKSVIKYLDSGKPFKGYLLYSKPLNNK